MVNDGRYPSLLINLPGKFRRIVQRSREKILWMKSISILLTLYRIDSDSLTNPSHSISTRTSVLFFSLSLQTKIISIRKEKEEKKKRKEHSIPNSTPFFRSSITISSSKKTKDRATLLSPFPHFPLVLSPPRGKNYSVDERAGEQGR